VLTFSSIVSRYQNSSNFSKLGELENTVGVVRVRAVLALHRNGSFRFAYGPYSLGNFTDVAREAILADTLSEDEVDNWWAGELEFRNGVLQTALYNSRRNDFNNNADIFFQFLRWKSPHFKVAHHFRMLPVKARQYHLDPDFSRVVIEQSEDFFDVVGTELFSMGNSLTACLMTRGQTEARRTCNIVRKMAGAALLLFLDRAKRDGFTLDNDEGQRFVKLIQEWRRGTGRLTNEDLCFVQEKIKELAMLAKLVGSHSAEDLETLDPLIHWLPFGEPPPGHPSFQTYRFRSR